MTSTDLLPSAISNMHAGRPDQAAAICAQVLKAGPPRDHAQALCVLGAIELARHRYPAAAAAVRRAIELEPTNPDFHVNLGLILAAGAQLDQAIAAYQQALRLKPDHADAFNNMGIALKQGGRGDEAVAAWQQAVADRPHFAEAWNNLGLGLRDQGQTDQAIAAHRKALELQPLFPAAWLALGVALHARGDLPDAVAAYRAALAQQPDYAEAYNNLGNALKDQGQIADALRSFDQAIALRPSDSALRDNRVYTVMFHPRFGAADILSEQKIWDQKHAAPLRQNLQPHANNRAPDRRLRIGWVSADFRTHGLARFILPLLTHRDRENFEIYCYSNVSRADDMTAQFRASADGWRDIYTLPDDRAAELVRQDQVDILVDLGMHMAASRLLVFARKPAPVQATFGAYPGGTGLSAMDWRLTDPYLDPPGTGDEFYTERSLRLADTFWCYDPAAMGVADEPDPGPLPALAAGHITFGCLNNFCKVTDDQLQLWAQILTRLPRSRLKLLAPRGSARDRVLLLMARQNVAPERIEFVELQKRQPYFQSYRSIDLGLDTLPYNGHTTTLDSMWMGVPVVTLVGQTVVGRAGFSHLSNLGLAELAANSPAQFVDIAATLAADLPRLSELRSSLRQCMLQSPLTDAARFAKSVESAYRKMWVTWCEALAE